MYKVKTIKFKIQQRGGESPDIQVTRTQYIPLTRFKHLKGKRKVKPIDYGVTEEQFTDILDKASLPIEKKDNNGNKK